MSSPGGRTRIKVCGLTNEADLRLAIELGADYAGFVFYPGSPRRVEPAKAAEMIVRAKRAGAGPISFVGVFVDAPPAEVRRTAAACGLDIAQLHGGEPLSYCRHLGLPCWKAVRIKDETSLRELEDFPGLTLLLDARVDGRFGGTGRPIPLDLVMRTLRVGRRVVVAGGVSAASLPAIWSLRPFAVDVSSSLEDRPGKKSALKLREFFAKAHELGG